MWDLDTIVTINNTNKGPVAAPRIYDLGSGKYALGFRGQRATKIVRRINNKTDRLGRGLPTYKGVQARKPIIGPDAKPVRRDDAGRLLRKALGV